MKSFKPMLAAPMDPEKDQSIDTLSYPVLATPKIDGIRCLIIDGVAMSRALKPIPNRFIQSIIGKPELNGLDGELLCGETFQAATSGIMSEDGEPDFKFHVFDDFTHLNNSYASRLALIKPATKLAMEKTGRCVVLYPVELHTPADLRLYLADHVAKGYEGVMVRKASGPYKFGRASFKEGFLTKIKPFETEEATVVGFEEAMENGNEATTNALGRTERSSHKANLIPKGALGALVCKNDKLWPGQTFNIGTGFTQAQRDAIWQNRAGYLGKLVSFQYQKIGTKDKPRCPSFRGFRDERDLSAAA